MSKITLSNVVDLTQVTTAQTTINNNSSTIQTAFDNTLSRDGTVPNQMGANLDMNSNQILNLPAPATVNSPARLIDVTNAPIISSVPPVGTSGAVVGLLNANNTVSGNNTFSGTNTFSNPVTFSNTVTFSGTYSYRKVLTANTTFYVDVTNGNDANSGLSPGIGNAWKTINHAIPTVCNTYDFGGNTVTIQLADGTYLENIVCLPYIGRAGQSHSGGPLLIQGNLVTPSNVIIAPASGNCVTAIESIYEYQFTGMKFVAAAGAGVSADFGSWIVVNNVVFGACSLQHMISSGGIIEVNSSYTINGNSQYHLFAVNTGKILFNGTNTITLSGTPAFTAFLFLDTLSYLSIPFSVNTFSGAATGQRYNVNDNAVANTSSGGATYLPGSTSGAVTNGGLYL